MINHYSVAIPTNPYLKAFITRFYGDPISINNRSHIGVFLIGVMSKENFSTRMAFDKKDIRYKFFTEKIQCVAPVSLMSRYGYYLSEDQVIQINRYFETLFEEQLYFYVQRNIDTTKRRSGYEKAIENFADFYNIELNEKVSFDCLKKIEYRFRKKTEKISLTTLSAQKQPQVSLF
jgi:hypothetical protein